MKRKARQLEGKVCILLWSKQNLYQNLDSLNKNQPEYWRNKAFTTKGRKIIYSCIIDTTSPEKEPTVDDQAVIGQNGNFLGEQLGLCWALVHPYFKLDFQYGNGKQEIIS